MSKPLLAGLVVLVGAGAVLALELTDTTHLFHDEKAVSGKIPVTESSQKTAKPSASADKSATPTPASPAVTNDKTGASAESVSSLPLVTPYGNFVSNHSPNLGGSPAPSKEQSVCNTTPGASCTITFTNDDGVVKSLPSQKADGNGLVYWTWDVNDAGFTAGDWKITATATLNGDSKSATDQLKLSVKP